MRELDDFDLGRKAAVGVEVAHAGAVGNLGLVGKGQAEALGQSDKAAW